MDHVQILASMMIISRAQLPISRGAQCSPLRVSEGNFRTPAFENSFV